MTDLLCQRRYLLPGLLVGILTCARYEAAFSQVSDKVSSITTSEAKAGEPLTISADLVKTISFDKINLAYRQFGQTEYRQTEMSVANNVASVTIPGRDVQPPFLEYYFLLYVQGSSIPETYPIENPENHPLKTVLRPGEERDGEILVLSPEKGERLIPGDLFISISLLRASSAVDRKRTKIFIDENDVTTGAVFSDELIILRPENLALPLKDGDHTMRVVLYDNSGNLYHSLTWPLSTVSSMEAVTVLPFIYNASILLESRNETIGGSTQSYNRSNLTSSATYGDFTLRGRLYVTSEEKDFRQPQNRFFIGLESPWVRAGYGDSYPAFPRLIMEGKRLRGLTGTLSLGFFNLEAGLGQVVRKIEGDTVRTFLQNDTLAFQMATNPVVPYDTTGSPDRWAEIRSGSFTRELFVVRPSFGKGENFQLGFSYLKSKDDIGSIKYGVTPQENLVLGSDVLVAVDNHRFELTAQAAFSATNKDISTGNITDAEIDRQFTGSDSVQKREDFRSIRDKLSRFMTINTNIVPLSLTNLTTLAYEGALTLSYPSNNYFRFSYLRRGPAYESFGQTFVRTDVRGFTVFDRVRLMENQWFISGGFERLEDNLGQTKPAATIFTTFNATVSYYPRTDFPNVTVGYVGAVNDNGLGGLDPLGADSLRARSGIEDRNSRVYVQVGHDFGSSVRHSAALSLGLATRDDKTFRDQDAKNTTVSLFVSSTYEIPLQTTAGITVNLNRSAQFISIGNTASTDFNYTTLLLNAQYRLMEEKLRLGGTMSPTFGDLRRVVYDATAQYFILRNMSLLFQFGVYQNIGLRNDVVWTLMFRFDV